MAPQPKSCETCGTTFQPRRSTAKFCTTTCRTQAAKVRAGANVAAPPKRGGVEAAVRTAYAAIIDTPKGQLAVELAAEIDATKPPMSVAAASRELRQLLPQLDAMKPKGQSPLDTIRDKHQRGKSRAKPRKQR